MLASFLWGRRAQSRCLAWRVTHDGSEVTGEPDGFSCLPGQIIHRRSVRFRSSERTVIIEDNLAGSGSHEGEWCFQLAEGCSIRALGEHRFEVDAGPGSVLIEIDPSLEVTQLAGSMNPMVGWVSRSYHSKLPAPVLLGRRTWERHARCTTRLSIL
jgi:hypothetical protein